MRKRLFAFVALASIYSFTAVVCAAGEPRKPKSELEVVTLKATVGAGTFTVEVRLKNTAATPLRQAKLVFTLLDANQKAVSTRHAAIEPEEFGAGEETQLSFETKADDVSVAVRVEAVDNGGRTVSVKNGGPFPIE